MEPNELRIGNYLTNFLGETFKVNQMTICYWGETGFENPKPIKLTEEWLLRLGFTKDNGWSGRPYYRIDADIFELQFAFDETGLVVGLSEDSAYLPHIKYVHQLQNLYFALTGKEL